MDGISFYCIYDTDFLKVVRLSLDPSYMPSIWTKIVVESCYEYYELTKEAPENNFTDIIEHKISPYMEERKKIIREYISKIKEYKTNNNPQNKTYVLNRLSEFVHIRRFTEGAVEFAKIIDSGEVEHAREFMLKILRSGADLNQNGCDYFKDFSSMYSIDTTECLFPYGIKNIDAMRDGFKRKEFVVGLGAYKGSKSWSVIHLGVQALFEGLRVLHVSHENTREETEERYDRMIGGLLPVKYKDNPERPYYQFDYATHKITYKKMKGATVDNIEKRIRARKILKKYGGDLKIYKYPMGSCSMYDIWKLLDYLESVENFVPDVLINDYVDVMKPMDANKSTRDQLNEAYIEHKKMADERNMVVITLSQVRREAIEQEKIKKSDFAEDIRKLANVDTVYSICQTGGQLKKSIATFHIMAVRQGESGYGCGIVQNLDFGRFCTQSFHIKYSGSNYDTRDDKEEGDIEELTDMPVNVGYQGQK